MLLDHVHRRLIVASTLAVAVMVGLAGSVTADTQTGQVGHYSFRDMDLEHAAVVCVYNDANPQKLVSVIAKPPRLWWPDTNSSLNNQHGMVGWKAIVRVSLPGAYGPWEKIKESDVHKARAYEDNPAYDLSDAASFSKVTFSIKPSNYSSQPSAHVSVRFRAYWYKKSGAQLGSVTHDALYYQFRNTTGDGGTTACPIVLPAA